MGHLRPFLSQYTALSAIFACLVILSVIILRNEHLNVSYVEEGVDVGTDFKEISLFDTQESEKGSRATVAKAIPEGWMPFESVELGFSLWHPQELGTNIVRNGPARTVVLEDAAGNAGIQIFVVPYPDTVITENRFKMDVPSGVIRNMQQTVVAGVNAVTFESTDQSLGNTFEVWMIFEGYLYEITTYSDLRQWVTESLLPTWRFI